MTNSSINAEMFLRRSSGLDRLASVAATWLSCDLSIAVQKWMKRFRPFRGMALALRGEAMAPRGSQIPKPLEGCLGFIVVGAVAFAGGAKAALIVGGLFALGGFALLGDRRRNPFTGFGMMAFGASLMMGGIFIAGGNNPFEFPPPKVPANNQASATERQNNPEQQESGRAASPVPEADGKNLSGAESDAEQQGRINEENAIRVAADQEAEARATAEKKADQNLRLGKALETVNPRGALDYYREVLQQFPDLPQAKIAADRIRLLDK